MEYNGETYDQFVEATARFRDDVYPVLGLAGETGEFVEKVKKAWRKEGQDWVKTIDKEDAASELGDVIWYVTRIAHSLGYTLDQLLIQNMKKLKDRQINGKT